MMYEKTVAAALAETRDKFRLAEALAEDIPPRFGRTADDEISTRSYLEAAREAIIEAGGEPRSVETLADYRRTAIWVKNGGVNTAIYSWLGGVSFTAHNEARKRMSYDDFAAAPMNAREIREGYGMGSKDGDPEHVVQRWSPTQKKAAARRLMDDPEVAEAVADRVADDPVLSTRVERIQEAKYADAERKVQRGDQSNRERRRHSVQFEIVDGRISHMIRLANDALDQTAAVEFDAEEVELLADSLVRLTQAVDLLRLRVTGVGVDWDAEARKL